MATHLRILILEDFVDDVELIEHQLKKGDFSYTAVVVETREGYEQGLAEFKPDVVLSDHSLPMFDSMLALQMFHSYKKIFHPTAVFILVTGTVSEEFAVQIMKNGADDYMLKDRLVRLPTAVKNAFEKNCLKEQGRKEREEKLYLFDILQRSLHEIYLIDPDDFQFKYANEEALNNLGYSLDELQEMTPSDIIDDFEKAKFQLALQHAMERKKGLLLERNAIRKTGSLYPVQIHLQVIGQGKKRQILANVIDITEAKELEEQKELSVFIQKSFNHKNNLQESLRKVLEKICTSCGCVATEVYAREFNQPSPSFLASFNSYRMEGSVCGSWMAKKVYDLKTNQKFDKSTWLNEIAEEDWVTKAKIKGAVAIPIDLGGEVIAVMIGFLDRDDVEENNFSVLSDQVRTKLAGIIKRKKTEEELQKIFDFTPDILMVIGKDGYIRKVNPAMQKILGYCPEEMLTKSFEYLLHPEDRHVLEKWRGEDLKGNEVAHYENRWLANCGEYRWFSWSITPYLNGELHFAVGRDITDTKEQIDAIREQNNKLEEIAWKQSHVVRAPLTRLMACVEYLDESGEDNTEILLSVKSSAYEIDAIIKDIICESEKVDFNGKG